MMLACVDVDYRDPKAVAACVLFNDWSDAAPVAESTVTVPDVAPYEPGAFYKRELPCLLAVLQGRLPLDAVIVDAYVDLAPGMVGLGRHLFEAIHTPVVGVAKTSFAGATHAIPILRGTSKAPLFVTAVWMDASAAAAAVQRMSGPHRIPDLLRRVDQLCRTAPA